MKISNKALVAAAASVAATGLITATAMAATSASSDTYPPIVQKLADKFNLNPADVKSVFDQNRQDNKADRQQKLKATLDQAVKDGKLTQDQADKLLAKLKSLRDEFKSQNHQDRRQNHQQLHDVLEQWAKDNGISNLDEILPQPPAGHNHMM